MVALKFDRLSTYLANHIEETSLFSLSSPKYHLTRISKVYTKKKKKEKAKLASQTWGSEI